MHYIIDNSPKGEDCFCFSQKGQGYIHVDAAGASFRYSLEEAQQGKKTPSIRPNGLDAFAAPKRTLGAKVGQEFARNVIKLLDSEPCLSLTEAYYQAANALTHDLEKKFGYLSVPVWQREAWSFTHVSVNADSVHIASIGDVSTFVIFANGTHSLLPSDAYHAIEGTVQKERINVIINELGHPHGSDEFFSKDYAGFTHNNKTYEGLVQNRIDMIERKGLWKEVNGVFQAILGLEGVWAKNANIITLPRHEVAAVLTSSDGLYEKARTYGLANETSFIQAASTQDGMQSCANLVRAHERKNVGKAYSDDLSAVFFPVAPKLPALDCI